MAQEKKYRKLGGGSLRLNIGGKHRIIKPNEVFTAYPEEIPDAFLKSLQEVSGVQRTTKKIIKEEVPNVKEEETSKESKYTAVYLQTGWWNVVDSEGKIVNESKLRKAKAEELIQQLNAE